MTTSTSRIRFGMCRELAVPADVCRLVFSSDRTTSGDFLGHTTRGEMVIAHFTPGGEIAYIELVGDDKPCQQPVVVN